MRRINRVFPTILTIVAISLSFIIIISLGCEKGILTSKTATKLNVGIVTWPGFGPLFIANQKGYFKEQGIDVNISIIEDEAARRSAFASGQLDIAANTVDALASGSPKGVDGIIFIKTDESYGADGIVANKSIKTISQLRGKRIAYPKGLPSHYFLYQILKDNNLSINDIKSVYMEASDAGAAFAAGKIDAAVTWEPWLSQSAAKGNILATTKDKPGLIADVLMVSQKSANDKRDAIKGFLQAWFKGLDFMQKNHEESVKIIADGLKLSSADTDELMTLVKFTDPQENIRFFGISGGTNICSELFMTASDLWLAEKIIDKKADSAQRCNGTFISQISNFKK